LYDDANVYSTGADTLQIVFAAYTLPPDTLDVGDVLKIKGSFKFAGNLNTKTIYFSYGFYFTTEVFSTINAFPAYPDGLYTFEVEVHKYSSTDVMIVEKQINGFVSPAQIKKIVNSYTPDYNIGSQISAAISGENGVAVAGDISGVLLTVELIKAP
jgi:hypothetical protein